MEPSDIKVVDAQPQGGAQASNNGLNPNVLLNNTLDGFANFSSKINPFAQRLNKGFGQVRQVCGQLQVILGRHPYYCWRETV